jgi:hypothetical protein
MATATKNGSQLLHTRSNFECMRIGSIGDNLQASEYAFLWQWEGLWPSKCSDDKAIMAMNLASPSEHFEGHRPSHCKRKISPCLGDPLLSIGRVGAGSVAVCVLLGGHFWRRWPRWWRLLLAVGRWLLRAYVRTIPTVRIVEIYLCNIFFCLNSIRGVRTPWNVFILFWS